VGVESGILYWHFVDVVWLFLFGAVYFWGGQQAMTENPWKEGLGL
jgi:hypothetical protein